LLAAAGGCRGGAEPPLAKKIFGFQ